MNSLPIPLQVNAASACLPGLKFSAAVKAITSGKLIEGALGVLLSRHLQLCPQTLGHLTEDACETLASHYPRTKFRLHANARVLADHHRLALAEFTPETKPYFAALADRSHRLGSPAYSLHAGLRASCSLHAMLDKWSRLQELFGDIPVAVEGLYPHGNHHYLMDSWAEYEQVLRRGIPLALDLSHLNIVAKRRGWQNDLLSNLLASPQCLEVHLSLNDGTADQHLPFNVATTTANSSRSPQPTALPAWLPYLTKINSKAIIFSEGNQFRQAPRRHLKQAS